MNQSNEKNNLNTWNQIKKEIENIYPNQKEPKYEEPIIKWNDGGEDLLDKIMIYDGGSYWHFITYGLSKHTEEMNPSNDYKVEFSLKLKKDNYKDEEAEFKEICKQLQSIAKITWNIGITFSNYEYLYVSPNYRLGAKNKSNIIGFISVLDPTLKQLDTQNLKIEFIEFIGITKEELNALTTKKITTEELYQKLKYDITDYNRDSVI